MGGFSDWMYPLAGQRCRNQNAEETLSRVWPLLLVYGRQVTPKHCTGKVPTEDPIEERLALNF